MKVDEKIIYRLDDKISFRKCTLADGDALEHGDCTNSHTYEANWKNYYSCNQGGIHYHCTKHPEIELELVANEYGNAIYKCPRCGSDIEIENPHELKSKCLRMLNIPKFKGAKLIRLDDWYVPEIKEKKKTESGYWIHTDVKTDKDGDTIIVVYVGHKDNKEKVQYFIKPEKGQLTSDHKDLDPAKILSKIEVQLKNRKIIQEYDEE
ncbi:MAG: hypothetical protein OSJ72_01710 [Lachnospiraceae bacterium]|nr:hypothetical protein [Lachnospiraceae bacterium]